MDPNPSQVLDDLQTEFPNVEFKRDNYEVADDVEWGFKFQSDTSHGIILYSDEYFEISTPKLTTTAETFEELVQILAERLEEEG